MMTSSEKNLCLVDVLDALGDSDDIQDIFIEPPEVSELTDEDLGEEDGVEVNHLSRNQLLVPAEVKRKRKQDDYDKVKIGEVKKSKSKLTVKSGIVWSMKGKTIKLDKFPSKKSENYYKDMSAVEYFELFFDDEIVDIIIAESTNYSLSKNLPDIKLTRDELRTFFAILIVSGYNPLPGKAMYWSSGEDLRNTAIYEAMRRDRFNNIMRSLHFKSNLNLDSSDKFSKLRPLISHLQKKFMQHFIPTEAISHDEAMIEYFGKHSCKQAIRNKPIRFGYKAWCQNTTSGYLIAFQPYQGKTFQGDYEIEKEFGKCTSTLINLLDTYPLSKSEYPYHFYCDNLFTTLPLLKELKHRGYNCTGTIRANRLGSDCPLSTPKQFEKKERGYTEVATAKLKGDSIFVSRWKDNSVVTVASTCFAANPEGNVTRWSKANMEHIRVNIPCAIQNYNQNMGGTDRMNQNVNAYRTSIRGKKWWWPLFTWLLDVSVNNAWLLAKKSNPKLNQLSFRRDLAMSYLLKQQSKPKTSGRKRQSSDATDFLRFDRCDHFVRQTSNNKRRRCVAVNCKSAVRTECSKCNVGLCIPCFQQYHIK